MPKELIVSVNGREKKIAIVENGRVTEFYIERGEASQGIVGNIYKGRVMRVLPGMQSAFVDIGLERDAFLYVSDFFDEEEEFERIVVDKTKVEGADAESAARAATERIERARIEREREMEEAQDHAEPASVGKGAGAESAAAEEADEAAAAPVAAAPVAREQYEGEEAEAGGRGKRRRGRGGRERAEGERGAATSGAAGAPRPRARAAEDLATPFSAGAASFERIVDDEAAAEEGSMFKDARLQERLSDQIRGVEFDLEDTTASAEVGSLLSAGSASGSSFQRIDDSDEAPSGQSRRSVRPEVARSVARLVDEFEDAGALVSGGREFERVSDDERPGEATPASPGLTAAEKGASGRQATAKKSPAKKAAKKGAASDEPADEETPRRASKKPAASRSAAKKAPAASKKKTAAKGGMRGRKTGEAEGLGESDRESRQEAKNTDGEGSYDNAQASVKGPNSRGEFARRGGRRRRRGGTAGAPGEERPNGDGEEAEVVTEVEESAPVEQEAAPPPPAAAAPAPEQRPATRGRGGRREEGARREEGGRESREGREGREGRESRGGREGREGRGGREGREARSEPRGDARGETRVETRGDARVETRGEGRGDNRGNGHGGGGGGRDRGRDRGGRDRGRGGQPTITDLLREGQEIIVQIAKEPIAQKGARITSHIALPGRFLVYMPTVDHVGVSRKIESDQERIRLRKLIQKIVQEEDVPSGGFIVRTAGVGITEQDLRDDARYLVRTWKDIRRNAEKQKAPALAHKDLDLVQRILRDQLSEDFTAIRIDSEEEYLDVVEFVNRIQPRLVNRVKLYTREAPILEAYGVDVEIEKAIKPRVWLKSGGYLVINQTEALVAIDVNTGKFVGRGGSRLEDTITRTNLEAVDEIARQIRLRDLGGIIVLDLIDMEERRNRQRVMTALQDALRQDKSPTKVLSFNDFGLVIMTRKRVKQSLERTLCSPCPYCQGAGLVKSPQTVCYEILEEARRLARGQNGERVKQTTLRLNTEVARALRSTERDVLREIEDYLGAVDITSEEHLHQEQFDFAFI